MSSYKEVKTYIKSFVEVYVLMLKLKSVLDERIKTDTIAIPFSEINRVLDVLPYGCPIRCMFTHSILTGCRQTELSNMFESMMYRTIGGANIFWKCGKNQVGYRKEFLPDYFLEELSYMRAHYRGFGDRLYSPDARSFRKYFNRYRCFIGGLWNERQSIITGGVVESEYVYNLNGLRKTFATHVFYQEYQKWKDSGVALEMTSKRMKHSTTHMTAYHYLKNFEQLKIEQYGNIPIWQILNRPIQKKLNNYYKGNKEASKPLFLY